MEEKFNEATPQRQQSHLLYAPLATINMPAFVEQLKPDTTWKESDRNTITVFKKMVCALFLLPYTKTPKWLHIQQREL